MKDKRRKDRRCKVFEQTQASSPTEHSLFFLRWEKILPGSNGELMKQLLACSIPIRCSDRENQRSSVRVLGVVSSDGNIMPPFISSHGLRFNTNKVYIKCLEDVVLLWIETMVSGKTRRLLTGVCAMSYKRETLSWLWEDFCDMMWSRKYHSAKLLPYTRLSERPTNLRASQKMNWRQG